MKLNKSILGLVILFIFILSSCSQSRYGSLTRRSKTAHIAQSDKRVKKAKKEAGLLQRESATKSERSVEVSDENITDLTVYNEKPVVMIDSKSIVKEDLFESTPSRKKTKVKSKIKDIVSNQATFNSIENVKRQMDEQQEITSTSSDDVDSLLYLILVVILILLILSLLLRLLPFISGLLGLALLILLIYVVIQLL